MDQSFAAPALWGLAGAAPYAGTRLATALWGSTDIDDRIKKLAMANFAIALFTGPAASAALTSWLMVRFPGATMPAMAVGIGMLSNAVWPMITDRATIAMLLDRLGGWLLGMGHALEGEPPKETK